RRLATGSQLASMMAAAFTKLAADRRRTALFSIACAQDDASGSSRRIAISADVSTIIELIRVRHKGGHHDRRNGTAPSAVQRSPCRSPEVDRPGRGPVFDGREPTAPEGQL